MRILIVGANGMLAHDVRSVAERAGHELVLVDLPELDITDAPAVNAFFERERPEACVNCAAWTDVDGAETKRARPTRSTPRARATSRARRRGSARCCCTSPPTTCSTALRRWTAPGARGPT